MRRFTLPLIVLALLGGLLSLSLQRQPRLLPSPLIDRPLPAFSLPSLAHAGQTIDHHSLAGRVVVLNVWASWCGACRDEHPVLMDLARRHTTPVLGLNYKDTPDAARSWLARHGNPYVDSAVDASGRVGIDLGVYGVPETFVIDRAGRVRLKHVGPLTPQVVRDQIEPLLKTLEGQPPA